MHTTRRPFILALALVTLGAGALTHGSADAQVVAHKALTLDGAKQVIAAAVAGAEAAKALAVR